MKIIGIDGATKNSGLAFFEDGRLIDYKLISLSGDVNIRLPKMMMAICAYINKHKPDKIIMEKSILTTNVDGVQKLANLAGAVMFFAYSKGIEFEHQYPTEWRAKIGLSQSKKIKRDVLKQEAIAVVKQEYGLDVGDDVSEAILMARSCFDLPKIIISENNI
jgi:Holliday junction resolvasome RuvABC endonuclease subunit